MIRKDEAKEHAYVWHTAMTILRGRSFVGNSGQKLRGLMDWHAEIQVRFWRLFTYSREGDLTLAPHP